MDMASSTKLTTHTNKPGAEMTTSSSKENQTSTTLANMPSVVAQTTSVSSFSASKVTKIGHISNTVPSTQISSSESNTIATASSIMTSGSSYTPEGM